MDLLLLSSLLLITIILLSLPSLGILPSRPRKPNNNHAQLPPGQMGWPFIGETLDFISTRRKGKPQEFFKQRMDKHSPKIFKTNLIGEKTAVFCGPSGNKFLFSNEYKLVIQWWPKHVEKIFHMSPNTSINEESIKMRKLLPGFLKPNSLQNYVEIMDSITQKHLETYWQHKEDEALYTWPLVKQFAFDMACKVFLSIDDHNQIAKFDKHFHVLASGIFALPINLPGTSLHRAMKASRVIMKELLEIIRQRKNNETINNSNKIHYHDILQHMLTCRDEKNGELMSEMDIANKIIALLLGGHDTTTVVITVVMKYLAELPHIYRKVFQEQRRIAENKRADELLNWDDIQKMKYSWNVASEAMRLVPPVQGTFREAITDFTHAGFFIPKGWKLYWTTDTTHRNPKHFPEPDKFDPSRFDGDGPLPYTYVPFGGGPRMCPGKEFARLEILVFMYNVVNKFKWEKIFPDEGITVHPMPMPAKGLPIRLHPH